MVAQNPCPYRPGLSHPVGPWANGAAYRFPGFQSEPRRHGHQCRRRCRTVADNSSRSESRMSVAEISRPETQYLLVNPWVVSKASAVSATVSWAVPVRSRSNELRVRCPASVLRLSAERPDARPPAWRANGSPMSVTSSPSTANRPSSFTPFVFQREVDLVGIRHGGFRKPIQTGQHAGSG